MRISLQVTRQKYDNKFMLHKNVTCHMGHEYLTFHNSQIHIFSYIKLLKVLFTHIQLSAYWSCYNNGIKIFLQFGTHRNTVCKAGQNIQAKFISLLLRVYSFSVCFNYQLVLKKKSSYCDRQIVIVFFVIGMQKLYCSPLLNKY